MPAPPAPPIADIAPTQAQLTDYDRAQLATYLRLLDAASEGEGEAPWPPTKLEETLSLDLPGRHPPAFPSLPRQTLE